MNNSWTLVHESIWLPFVNSSWIFMNSSWIFMKSWISFRRGNGNAMFSNTGVRSPADGRGRGDGEILHFKQHVDERRELDALAVGETQHLVVVQNGVHVLYPERVHRPVADHPLVVLCRVLRQKHIIDQSFVVLRQKHHWSKLCGPATETSLIKAWWSCDRNIIDQSLVVLRQKHHWSKLCGPATETSLIKALWSCDRNITDQSFVVLRQKHHWSKLCGPVAEASLIKALWSCDRNITSHV